MFVFILRVGGREREKHQCEKNINQLPPVRGPIGNQTHNLGMRHRNQTGDLLVYGMKCQPTETHHWAKSFI